jgi:hypothetical protein
MGGLMRLVVGVAIGAGIAAAITKLAKREQPDDPATLVEGEPTTGGMRERLRQAGEAARAARAGREAELQSYFRRRVADPTAFTAPAAETVP